MTQALEEQTKNKAKFWGETKKEKKAKELYEKLSQEKAEIHEKLQGSKYKTIDTKDIEKAKESLAKAQKSFENEKQQQIIITQDRSEFPKEMNAKQCAKDLAKEISYMNTKSSAEQEELVARIKKTPAEILTAKFGAPPETLLNVSSKHSQGAAGVALLETASFNKKDMQQALETSKQVKTSMKKALTTRSENALQATHSTPRNTQQHQQSSDRSGVAR